MKSSQLLRLTRLGSLPITSFALCLILSPATHAQSESGKATVFVGAPVRGEFVDTSKEIQDSIKDLMSRLRGAKGLTLVPRREDANIVVTVVARGVGSEPYGQRLAYQQYYNNAELTSMPISLNTWWVAAVLEVGTYRKEFVGAYTHPPNLAYYGGAWGECAKRLGNDIKTWAEANGQQLRAKAQRQ